MEQLAESAIAVIKDSPSLAIWVLAIIYGFKVVVVGSIYGTIKHVVNKLHDVLVNPKRKQVEIDVEAQLRGVTIESRHLIHHSRQVSKAMPGQPIMLDTISKAFADARDRAATRLGIEFDSPPTFHEMRSLAARLHAAEGRDAQVLLGHKSSKMTDLYRDSRGAEWLEVR